jgi:hypothetical protein
MRKLIAILFVSLFTAACQAQPVGPANRTQVSADALDAELLVRENLSGRNLLDRARDCATTAPTVQRVDTSEQTAATVVLGRRIEQKMPMNVVSIEIDMTRKLARQTTSYLGQPLILLKQGENAAMKLGDGSWQAPTEAFAEAARDMGKLFVCEIDTPEDRNNAPTWKVVGTEMLDGQEAYVVESEGNSAVPLAQERMAKSAARLFAKNGAKAPTVKVLEYKARHWISKDGFRHLQAVQTSKVQISMPLADGTAQLIEQSGKSTSVYHYEKLTIELPAEAQKLFSPAP